MSMSITFQELYFYKHLVDWPGGGLPHDEGEGVDVHPPEWFKQLHVHAKQKTKDDIRYERYQIHGVTYRKR